MKQVVNSGKDGTSKILNSSQVYITMFVSQALLMLTMNTVYSNGARMQDFLISVGIAFDSHRISAASAPREEHPGNFQRTYGALGCDRLWNLSAVLYYYGLLLPLIF